MIFIKFPKQGLVYKCTAFAFHTFLKGKKVKSVKREEQQLFANPVSSSFLWTGHGTLTYAAEAISWGLLGIRT